MHSNFIRSYWFWHCGEGFQTILLMWYMAFHARLSPAEIGFYQSLQLLPFLLFTALGGALTDRIGARTSFAASTGLFALALGFYGAVEPAIGFSAPLFAGYCLISGVLSAISNPAIDTFIPDATPRPATANALLAATAHNIAKLSGNAATLLLPVLSAMGGFLANGLLMASSVLFLLRHPQTARTVRPAGPAMQPRALSRVIAHFRAHGTSFDILLSSAMLGLFVVSGFYVFQPLLLREWFPEHQGMIGLTGVIGWVAAILASGIAARHAARITRPGQLALAVWAGIGLLFALLPMVPSFGAYLVVLFFLGANGLGKALVYGHYLREAPPDDRALLIGIDQTAFWGLATLGTTGLGLVVQELGLTPALLVTAGAILVSVSVLTLRGRLTGLRRGA